MRCPACEEHGPRPFLELDSAPIFCNLLSPTPEAARALRRGRVDLCLCRACGLIYNAAFDPGALEYEGRYENALHFSPSFRAYVEELCRDLSERCPPGEKGVVEIGAGDGFFLGELCRASRSPGVGYDPAFAAERSMLGDSPGVRIIPAMFEPAHAAGAGLVTCRHVLEHIPEPLSFLRSLRAALDEDTPVFFEVPDADYMLREGAVWDVLYEHCSYFGAAPLRAAFQRAGFRVERTRSVYGGQFLTILARAGSTGEDGRPGAPTPPVHPPVDPNPALAFAEMYRAKVELWTRRLERLGAAHVALWGAGTKGVCFLNALGPAAAAISAIVDLNPRKWGHCAAGTGHEIVSPDRLKDLRPHLVIVANPLYRAEITDTLDKLGVAAEVASL